MRVNPGVFRPSLAFVLALPILGSPAQARADSFFEIGGGIAIPMADDDWTDAVETSPKLTVKAGAVPGTIGGAVSFDWTPVNTDAQGFSSGIASADVSAHRFRILANLLFHMPVQKKLHFEGRAGIGVDIAHASVSGDVLGVNFESSDTDAGLGLEVGAGMWFDVGSVQVGAQVALPVAMHDHQADNTGEITFDYTSYDFDLLFGVRFVSH
jgi:hypothetical protein